MNYKPHKWVIIKITSNGEQPIYKVIGGWYGRGYLDDDYYRINSGITKIEKEDDHYIFSGYSGSSYICGESNQGFTNLTSNIYNSIKNIDKNVIIELVNNVDEINLDE